MPRALANKGQSHGAVEKASIELVDVKYERDNSKRNMHISLLGVLKIQHKAFIKHCTIYYEEIHLACRGPALEQAKSS